MDITLDSNTFSIYHSPDGTPGYVKSFTRQVTDDQVVRPATQFGLTSRPDLPTLLQTSWSEGTAWWKPLISEGTSRMYFDNSNMDTFSTPGLVFPANKGTQVSTNVINIVAADGDWYAIRNSLNTDATYKDVYKWTPASDDWVRETGYTSGSAGASTPAILDQVYDKTDGYVYVLSTTHVSRYKPSTSAQDNTWVAVPSTNATKGDALMTTADGKVWLYNQGIMYELDKSGPSWTTRKDDGFGADALDSVADGATNLFDPNLAKLAVAGSSGVYYVKNTFSNGVPQAIVARVDRDQSGSYIRYPLGDMTPGFLALDVTLHGGSLVISGTYDWQLAIQNDRTAGEYPRIDFYHFTPGKGAGAIGSPDGTVSRSDMPWKFMGALGDWLIIGGNQRLWVYDVVRGGIHPWVKPETVLEATYENAFTVTNSSGEEQLFVKTDNGAGFVYNLITADPTTVVNFGDDTTTYSIESNYFDFGRPMEQKALLRFILDTEQTTANQRFTVYISVDDGSWTSIGTVENADYTDTDISSSAHKGYRFRYKIVYETKTAALFGVRGISFLAAGGRMTPQWRLRLNGNDIRNIENAPVDLEAVRDNLETSAAKLEAVTLIDNFKSHRIEDSETVQVMIQSVNVVKDTTGEAVLEVQLAGF